MKNTRRQTVYIVDDEPAVRDSLGMLLEAEGFKTQAFGGAADFLAACDAEMRGCLLLDILMPQMSGIELQAQLTRRGIDIPVIFLTGSGDIPKACQAFRGGALDFLEKPFDIDNLLEAVRRALSRDAELWHARHRRRQLREAGARLTPRETEILKWVAAGYSSKEIAHAVGISNRTVDVHRAHIMEKIQAHSLADLIAVAMELDASMETAACDPGARTIPKPRL